MRNTISILIITFFLTHCAGRLTGDKKKYLIKDLEEMVESDQIAAYIPQGKYIDYTQDQWNNFKDSVFASNKKRIELMFNKYGYLGFDKVGKDASNNFWLLVQHADKYPEFQKSVLNSLEREVKRKNADANNYAYLYDRVKVNAGEKQRFGTQLTYDTEKTGKAIPINGFTDLNNVGKFRKEYGLEPLNEYLNKMTSMHFEMNKEYYEKKGIIKPDLY